MNANAEEDSAGWRGQPGDPGGGMGGEGEEGNGGPPMEDPSNPMVPTNGTVKPPAEKKPARRIGAKPPPDRAPRSIYLFSLKNKFRKKCIEFVEWKPFEFLILVTILGNCVALAVYTPFPAEDTNERNLILVRPPFCSFPTCAVSSFCAVKIDKTEKYGVGCTHKQKCVASRHPVKGLIAESLFRLFVSKPFRPLQMAIPLILKHGQSVS